MLGKARDHGKSLEASAARIIDAVGRAQRRGVPEVKVQVRDLVSLFEMVNLSSQVAKGEAAIRRMPWWRRLLTVLREPRVVESPRRSGAAVELGE